MLRRAYVDWLMAGNATERGFGILAVDRKQIIKQIIYQEEETQL